MEIKSKEITMVSIKKIKPHPKNNNRHPIDQIETLTKIIEYQGFRVPLIVSNRSGFLVAGHARLLAAKKLKLKEVPVIYQDFDSDEKEWVFLTSDNAIAGWADLDLASVKIELSNLEEGFDLELLGVQDIKVELGDGVDPNKEWNGMPEFNQQDKTSFRHVVVHFTCQEDAEKFFALIGQPSTDKTRSIWFPPQENMDTENRRYGE